MQQNQKQPFWHSMLQKFLENFSMNFFSNLRQRIEHSLKNAMQKMIGAIILFIGFIFVLVALAILISDLLKTSPGVGYGIVGIFVILVGLLMSRTKKTNSN